MDFGKLLAPSLGKLAITLVFVFCYLNPWVFGVPLAGLLLFIYLPLKYAAVSLGTAFPLLLWCEGKACFPDSPLMVFVVFVYTYIIVGAITSACNFILRAAKPGEGAEK